MLRDRFTWSAAIALGALLSACGGERPPRSPASPRAPRGDIAVESFALVCPEGTRLRGRPPPAGRALWCERPDGTRHGPFLRWRAGGQLAELGEYAAGEPAWTVSCARGDEELCRQLLR